MSSAACFLPSTEFQSTFDTQPFLFHHNFSNHELFMFPALYRLARKAATRGTQTSKGMLRQPKAPGFFIVQGRGGLTWGSPEFLQELDHAFEHFEQSNVRLKLTAIHEYEGYRELLAECTRNLSEVTGVDFSRHYDSGLATLFISSPNETTPYHIDQEINFLLEIHGQKVVRIFDSSIVSRRDMEEYWFGHSFLEQVPGSTSREFEIGPGEGVFNPPFFPHTVRTGPEPCVSLSLGFSRLRFPEAEVHRMNAYLRKLGCTPREPGARPKVDWLKSVTIRRAVSLKRSLLGD
jgi:hypothetical protein